MQCLSHKDMIVLWGFSQGPCQKCEETVHTHYTPCHRVCEECSMLYGLCQVCGKKLSPEEIDEIIEDENQSLEIR